MSSAGVAMGRLVRGMKGVESEVMMGKRGSKVGKASVWVGGWVTGAVEGREAFEGC